MTLVNYSGTPLAIDVERTVHLLSAEEIAKQLGTTPGNGVRAVAFESSNTVTNTGTKPWLKASGLVSIWILGQFNPTPQTTIALPVTPGPEATLGPVVNDAYFGKVPADRLVVKGSVVLFRADGQYRSKIGLPPARARSVAGSYDAGAHVLTIVQVLTPVGCHRLRELDVGDAEGAFQGGRHQQLQRRSAGAREATARTLLRARDLLTSPEPVTRRALHSHPSDISFRRTGT